MKKSRKEILEEMKEQKKKRNYIVAPSDHVFNKNYFPNKPRRYSVDKKTVIIPVVGSIPNMAKTYNFPVYKHPEIIEYMKRNKDSWVSPPVEEKITKLQHAKKLVKNKSWRRSHYNAIILLSGLSYYGITEYNIDPFFIIPISVILEKWVARKFFVYKKRIKTKIRNWLAKIKKK